MVTGQVGFKDPRKVLIPSPPYSTIYLPTDPPLPQVKKILIEARLNAIVNRLNKTKVELHPDLAAEKEAVEKGKRQREKQATLMRKKEEARIAKEFKEKAWQRDHAYDDIFAAEALEQSSNQDRGADFYDDFM